MKKFFACFLKSQQNIVNEMDQKTYDELYYELYLNIIITMYKKANKKKKEGKVIYIYKINN